MNPATNDDRCFRHMSLLNGVNYLLMGNYCHPLLDHMLKTCVNKDIRNWDSWFGGNLEAHLQLFRQIAECSDDFDRAFEPEMSRREVRARCGSPGCFEHDALVRANLCALDTHATPCPYMTCRYWHVWWCRPDPQRDATRNECLYGDLVWDPEYKVTGKLRGRFLRDGITPMKYP